MTVTDLSIDALRSNNPASTLQEKHFTQQSHKSVRNWAYSQNSIRQLHSETTIKYKPVIGGRRGSTKNTNEVATSLNNERQFNDERNSLGVNPVLWKTEVCVLDFLLDSKQPNKVCVRWIWSIRCCPYRRRQLPKPDLRTVLRRRWHSASEADLVAQSRCGYVL